MVADSRSMAQEAPSLLYNNEWEREREEKMGGGSHTGHQGELTLECIYTTALFRVCYLSSTFVIFPSAPPRDVMGLNQANKAHGGNQNKRDRNKRENSRSREVWKDFQQRGTGAKEPGSFVWEILQPFRLDHNFKIRTRSERRLTESLD